MLSVYILSLILVSADANATVEMTTTRNQVNSASRASHFLYRTQSTNQPHAIAQLHYLVLAKRAYDQNPLLKDKFLNQNTFSQTIEELKANDPSGFQDPYKINAVNEFSQGIRGELRSSIKIYSAVAGAAAGAALGTLLIPGPGTVAGAAAGAYVSSATVALFDKGGDLVNDTWVRNSSDILDPMKATPFGFTAQATKAAAARSLVLSDFSEAEQMAKTDPAFRSALSGIIDSLGSQGLEEDIEALSAKDPTFYNAAKLKDLSDEVGTNGKAVVNLENHVTAKLESLREFQLKSNEKLSQIGSSLEEYKKSEALRIRKQAESQAEEIEFQNNVGSVRGGFDILGQALRLSGNPEAAHTVEIVGSSTVELALSIHRFNAALEVPKTLDPKNFDIDKFRTSCDLKLTTDIVSNVVNLIGGLIGGPSANQLILIGMQEIKQSIADMGRHFDQRFDLLDHRMTEMWVALDSKLDTIIFKLGDINQRISDIQQTLFAVFEGQKDMERRILLGIEKEFESKELIQVNNCFRQKTLIMNSFNMADFEECVATMTNLGSVRADLSKEPVQLSESQYYAGPGSESALNTVDIALTRIENNQAEFRSLEALLGYLRLFGIEPDPQTYPLLNLSNSGHVSVPNLDYWRAGMGFLYNYLSMQPKEYLKWYSETPVHDSENNTLSDRYNQLGQVGAQIREAFNFISGVRSLDANGKTQALSYENTPLGKLVALLSDAYARAGDSLRMASRAYGSYRGGVEPAKIERYLNGEMKIPNYPREWLPKRIPICSEENAGRLNGRYLPLAPGVDDFPGLNRSDLEKNPTLVDEIRGGPISHIQDIDTPADLNSAVPPLVRLLIALRHNYYKRMIDKEDDPSRKAPVKFCVRAMGWHEVEECGPHGSSICGYPRAIINVLYSTDRIYKVAEWDLIGARTVLAEEQTVYRFTPPKPVRMFMPTRDGLDPVGHFDNEPRASAMRNYAVPDPGKSGAGGSRYYASYNDLSEAHFKEEIYDDILHQGILPIAHAWINGTPSEDLDMSVGNISGKRDLHIADTIVRLLRILVPIGLDGYYNEDPVLRALLTGEDHIFSGYEIGDMFISKYLNGKSADKIRPQLDGSNSSQEFNWTGFNGRSDFVGNRLAMLNNEMKRIYESGKVDGNHSSLQEAFQQLNAMREVSRELALPQTLTSIRNEMNEVIARY